VLLRRRNRPAPVEERRSCSGGGAESGGARAEMSLPPTPRTSEGSGLVCPFNPTSAGRSRADDGSPKFICGLCFGQFFVSDKTTMMA
jgi:hypothetical protein